MTAMGYPEPGWHEDPNDPTRQRWWDGTAWTESGPPPSSSTPSTTGTVSLTPSPPGRWGLVIVVGAVVVIFAAFGNVLIGLTLGGLGIVLAAITVAVRGPIRGVPITSRGGGIIVAAVAVLALGAVGIGGAVAAVVGAPDTVELEAATTPGTANSNASPAARTATPTPTPTRTQVTVTEPIAYASVTVDDPNLDLGVTTVTTPGVAGVRTLTYSVTSRNGVEVDRTLVSDVVTVQPVDEVTNIGTRQPEPPPAPAPAPEPACDPNYADACVPIADDVDCEGGSGNGPAYVAGPVRVVGSDIYGLDRDGNGIGCE